MKADSRPIKHFSLHRIAGTELRVVSDVEAGVIPLIRVEAAVIEGYSRSPDWRQEIVTLFVLRDMQPLVRQLAESRKQGAGRAQPSVPGLEHRPVVNVYDLKNPHASHIFVNQAVMEKEGYWGDDQAAIALLAHEHAHPLAECETIRSSRVVKVALAPAVRSAARLADADDRHQAWLEKIRALLADVAARLCLHAPREVFANQVVIQNGFGEALLYLDRKNVGNAAQSVRGKETLRRQLLAEVVAGDLTPTGADLLLLIGELSGYLDLALETAAFYRQAAASGGASHHSLLEGPPEPGQELEAALQANVFPFLEPEVGRAYVRLREGYSLLPDGASPRELTAHIAGWLDLLAQALRVKGLELNYSVEPDD